MTLGGLVRTAPEPFVYASGDEFGFTFLSDLHIGARNVDYAAMTRDLDRAKKHGDRININGDVFDGILPSDQKRFLTSALDPRLHGHDDILNGAIDIGVEILSPYAELIDMIGAGNHDDSVLKYHHFDPVLLLVDRLNQHLRSIGSPHVITYGGYSGIIDYRFETDAPRCPRIRRFLIFYHHGIGGSGSFSSSAGDFQKFNFVEGADVLWLGHRHSKMQATVVRLCFRDNGTVAERPVHFIRTGAYLRTYGIQHAIDVPRVGRRDNYASVRAYEPQGMGGYRLILSFPTVRSLEVRAESTCHGG